VLFWHSWPDKQTIICYCCCRFYARSPLMLDRNLVVHLTGHILHQTTVSLLHVPCTTFFPPPFGPDEVFLLLNWHSGWAVAGSGATKFPSSARLSTRRRLMQVSQGNLR
jgi:hypothetical protein